MSLRLILWRKWLSARQPYNVMKKTIVRQLIRQAAGRRRGGRSNHWLLRLLVLVRKEELFCCDFKTDEHRSFYCIMIITPSLQYKQLFRFYRFISLFQMMQLSSTNNTRMHAWLATCNLPFRVHFLLRLILPSCCFVNVSNDIQYNHTVIKYGIK